MKLYSAEGISAESFSAHIRDKLKVFHDFLKNDSEQRFSSLLISSGQPRMRFADDMAFPFQANPYFREWLPLTQRENCFLHIKPGKKPCLYLDVEEDIWHTAPQTLPDDWLASFTVVEFSSRDALAFELKPDLKTMAYFGEANELELPVSQTNPAPLRFKVDYHRRFKTEYEHGCIRQANKHAAHAHLAARDAFLDKGSELDIKRAYLASCAQADAEMPYGIIAGLNEHAAILHHFMLDAVPPGAHRSFLIDAGVDVNGYASDITRTYSFNQNDDFSSMINALDDKQKEMCATVSAGASAISLHEFSHLKIAELLAEFKLIRCSAEAAVEKGISNSFYPHGIGHGLGVNVHELGGQLADELGTVVPPPPAYPRLRNTGDFAASAVHTVEPGLYFIPSLLADLKESDNSVDINWGAVEAFVPYGGVRIEDNVRVLPDGGIENLTRDAFANC